MKTIIKLALAGLIVLPAVQAPAAFKLFENCQRASVKDASSYAVRAGGLAVACGLAKSAYEDFKYAFAHRNAFGGHISFRPRSVGAAAVGSIGSLFLGGAALFVQRKPLELIAARKAYEDAQKELAETRVQRNSYRVTCNRLGDRVLSKNDDLLIPARSSEEEPII
jgi:hypothetical protein